ncbi:LamG domain-containing protein [Terrimonas pollutisoli]|uniref:LamG domain-containing protein n=1 Tax=Terrimonas pollutisoli TaxID=3034147 RepID=UPI0023ECB8EA|nr:LamG domain-containing protein [Terrimonas sp. H1YJ31]
MDRPLLASDYPVDHTVTPTTPLRFYVPFDSTDKSQSQINIRFMDSISGYPSLLPDQSVTAIAGIRGTAYNSSSSFVQYLHTNDFVATAQSFTVAFWFKHDGVPNDGQAQFVFALPSTIGHWSGGTMFLLLDHPGAGATNELAVLKFVAVDKNNADGWFEWKDANRIPGIQDNNWHHLAFVYDQVSSKMTLYIDGTAHSYTPDWWGGSHGGINMDATKAGTLKIGGRPKEDLGWGKSFLGGLDQFRLYNTALTAAEVANLYNGKL